MTMKMRVKRAVVLVAAAVVAMASSGSAMQTAATGRLMREKLTHAQRVLEALTTSNYALLERESSALSEATKELGWMVLRTPEYARQSEAFLRSTEELVAAAKHRDLDLAAIQYVSMTMSCYQCHRYMKNMRIAK
jgi:hypothetical protein